MPCASLSYQSHARRIFEKSETSPNGALKII
jgi:hypothetical protein